MTMSHVRMTRPTILLFLLGPFLLLDFTIAWGIGEENKKVDWKEKITGARNSEEAGKAYLAMLQETGPKELLHLKDDVNTGIALQAAWKLRKETTSYSHPQRLIGFLEGRTGLEAPIRWQYSFTLDYAQGPRSRSLVDDLSPFCPFMKKVEGDGYDEERVRLNYDAVYYVLEGDDVKVKEGKLIFSTKTGSIAINKETIKKIKGNYAFTDFACLLDTPKRFFIGIYSPWGDKFPLICADPKSGEVIWHSTVWSLGFENIGKSPIRHGGVSLLVSLVVKGNKIGVFGSGNGGSFVEAFDDKKGDNLFRFSTNYWFQEKPQNRKSK